MKHTLLKLSGLFISLISINSQAQSIASAILLQDGTTVDSSHVFIDGETPTFHVQNDQCENGFWTFSFYDEDGMKEVCVESETGADSFTFKIAPGLFSGLPFSRESQHIEFPNDSSVYSRCSVDLHQGDIIVDSVTLILNVLPSRPKVKKASILGNFDFEDGGYTPLAELTILFSSERMNECWLLSYSSDSVHVFQFPEIYGGVYEPVNVNEICKNYYEFKYNYADWGEFYTITSLNKYGGVEGDTIFTNSIIYDPEILSYLETIHNQAAAIDEMQDENWQIYIHNNKLITEGLHSTQISTEIYSVNGTLIKRSNSTDAIDLNNLQQGVYVVKIRSNKKNKYIKINKR